MSLAPHSRSFPACAAIAVAALLAACEPPPGSDVPKVYQYDIQALRNASNPQNPAWRELPSLPLALRDPRAIAAGPGGSILAAGDRALLALDPAGHERWRTRLPSEPRCAAASPSGSVFVGYTDHVGVLDADGRPTAEWTSLGENAVITSIAAGPDRVWVADAGARKVAIFDPTGRLLGLIQGPDEFVVPSPFFDAAASPSGGVWVANPGWLRVEHYGADGRLTTRWGEASMDPAGFAGCCNPIHIALLPDGGFATSEKGIPRVKTYGPDGRFRAIVAGPGAFAEDTHGLDLAVDPAGRILVLDPERRAIRIFEQTRKDGS